MMGGALPCARLACAASGDGVSKLKRTSLISPALRAECNTVRAGSDKSIGLQAILNGNAANKLGGSPCADLTALRGVSLVYLMA